MAGEWWLRFATNPPTHRFQVASRGGYQRFSASSFFMAVALHAPSKLPRLRPWTVILLHLLFAHHFKT